MKVVLLLHYNAIINWATFVTTMFRQVPPLLDDNDVNDDVVHGHHHILLLVLHTKVGPLG